MVEIHFPTGQLSTLVESIVYAEYDPDHAIERLIPDGSVNLIIELGDQPQYIYAPQNLSKKQEYTHSWISGIQMGYITISAKNPKGMCIIRFSPMGAHTILHLPIAEIKNLVVDAALIIGSTISELRERLMETSTVAAKFQLINTWLENRVLHHAKSEQVIQYFVDQVHKNLPQVAIKELIDKSGHSHRHFNYLFKKHIGVSPKQYHRITRFNKVLEQINNGQMIDWLGISTQCGYYDQAHFIKEFKMFSGYNPERFLIEKGEYINYIPII